MYRSYSSAVAASSMAATLSTTVPALNNTIDINHPYFLSSVDHSGLALVNEPLTYHNFHHWSRSVQIVLSAKLKLGFIDGSLEQPTNPTQLALWKRSNDLVISWILNFVSSKIRKSVVYLTTAKQIWCDLAARYSQTNVPHLFQLRKDIASLSQGTKPITAYFTLFRGLLDELNSLSPRPRCICVNCNCTCNNSQKLDANKQYIKLSQFLMGLSEQFTTTHGQILLKNPLPDITHAYSMLLQEENQRNFTHQLSPTIPEKLAMNVQVNSRSKQTVRKVTDSSILYDYYKRTGHTKDKYFSLHGYPDWHRHQGQPKPKLCLPSKAKALVASSSSTSRASAESDDLSDKQCQKLIAMLQSKLKSSTEPSQNAPWIQGNAASQMEGSFYQTHAVMFAHNASVSVLDDS